MAKRNDEQAAAEAVVADAQETVKDAAEAATQAVTDAAAAAPAEAPADPTKPIDPDLAAFEAAEREYPDLFSKANTEAAAAKDAAAEAATTALGTNDPNESHDSLAAAVAPSPTATADQATQVLPSDPARNVTPVPNYPAPQSPILVPAPEPPHVKGNRGKIAFIGIFAALTFAVLYFLVDFISALVNRTATLQGFVDFGLERLTNLSFWAPTVAFYIGFWFLGLFVNRAKWGKWVFFSFIPGLFAWGGVALGALVANEFWKSSTDQMLSVAEGAALTIHGLAAFLIGREVTVWYGKWAAHSGAKKVAKYEAEEAEYERTIEAGPQL